MYAQGVPKQLGHTQESTSKPAYERIFIHSNINLNVVLQHLYSVVLMNLLDSQVFFLLNTII